MKANCTRIAVILDRSGSMSSVRESTVAGFNEFIKQQKELPGECSVKLVQFDNEYEVVFDKPLKDVPELTQATFVPRGSTALLDAQGRTIVTLGEELSKLSEDQRPSKVIVVTLTDGQENASREYKLEQIAAMIKEQREVYNWDFVFLGANQDAVKTAATMNIPMQSSITYAANRTAMGNVMRSVSAYVGSSRVGLNATFNAADRSASMVSDEDKDDWQNPLAQNNVVKVRK